MAALSADAMENVAAVRAPRGSGRSARTLLLAAILGPALLFAAFAWWSWERVQQEATAEITRTVDILAEQATRLLRIEELLLADTDSRLQGLSWPDMLQHRAEVDSFLASAAANAPEIVGLYVVDPDGMLRLGVRFGPTGAAESVPANLSFAGRAFFNAAKANSGLVMGGPAISKITGREIVDVARRLTSSDGSFRGVVVASLAVDRLTRSWQEVISRGDAVALIRDDGTFLARLPALPSAIFAQPNPRITQRFADEPQGIFEAQALSFDKIPRRLGFRKLTPFPAYLAYGVDESNIAGQWYPVATAFGLLTLAAALGLVYASSTVIRRARSEALAHEQAEITAQALAKSEESQRALFRKAPAAMHSLDSERRIIDVNDRWIELFGYAREDVVGRRITEFYLAFDEAQREGRWREIIERGGLEDEERQCIAKNGTVFDALVSVALEREASGRFVRVITTVTDISARKRAEAAARGAETFAELLIENSIDGIIVKDHALRYTVFNRAMESLTGFSREQVLGHVTEEALPQVAQPVVRDAWQAALEGRSTRIEDEIFAFPPPGRAGHCEQTIAPLRDAHGSIIGALSFVRDTTERRRMEDVLRQAQKMEAVGQLTGGIAHDFNNLLTVILGNLEQLQRHAPNSSQLLRFAEAATRGAERAAILTQRLLAFSRRQPLEPRPLDLNRLVPGVADMLRRVLGETISLELVLSARLWRVFADANQIENALLNLAVNARDAMPGGGTLTIQTANTTLEAEEAGGEEVTPGQYAMIAVGDTGIGMPPEVQARAFEPFYTTKETGHGSGLGLSQVYGFARQSGGCAKIVSSPGEGTTVQLFLPRYDAAADANPATPRERALPYPSGRGRTVLVVEDDRDVRAHSAQLLRELGYRVIEAHDGAEALRRIAGAEDVHLLFTDIGLPGGLDGRALAAQAVRRRPELKVLFTTGYAAGAFQSPDGLAGAAQLLTKPFSFSALAAKVQDVLDREPAPG